MSYRFLDISVFYARRLLYVLVSRLLRFLLKKELFARKYFLILPLYQYFHNHVDDLIVLSVSSMRHVLNGEDGSLSISITDTGTVQLYISDKLYLFPGGRRSNLGLSANYESWSFLKSSSLASIVDYELIRFESEGSSYYQCEILFPWRGDDAELKGVLRSLNGCVACPQDALRRVKRGKDLALKHFKADFEFILSDDLLKSLNFRASYMHGDLTPNNVLSNGKGNLVLIDLDRFNCNGWDSFDSIHYNVEFAAAEENKNWFCIVERDFFNSLAFGGVRSYIYCYYFLYRLSFEIGAEEYISYKYGRLATMLAKKMSDERKI